MRTRAAVLSGKEKIFIREFELPEIQEEELLVKVISNGICLSTYKAAKRGEEHKRVPQNISEHPVITGHEFAGIIVKVGEKLKNRYKVGQKFVLQPAMGLESGYSAGYSYEYFGGNATYCIIPKIAIDLDCVLPYDGKFFAAASLAEPMCCIIGAYHATYHTTPYVYKHEMGLKENGSVALLGCAGPMGLGAIDYALNGPYKSKRIVVVDIDEKRLAHAEKLLSVETAKEKGVDLVYLNTKNIDAHKILLEINEGKGYDEVFVYAANEKLVELADDILGNDGCLNFFAGPTNEKFKVPFNFYNVHYESTHIVGTSGGSEDDMRESLKLTALGKINPAYMVTHIGGLNAVPETILNLPNIPGGKKLVYPHIEMDLTAISDFEKLGKSNEMFKKLAEICKAHNNLWCEEAEEFLLNYMGVTLD